MGCNQILHVKPEGDPLGFFYAKYMCRKEGKKRRKERKDKRCKKERRDKDTEMKRDVRRRDIIPACYHG